MHCFPVKIQSVHMTVETRLCKDWKVRCHNAATRTKVVFIMKRSVSVGLQPYTNEQKLIYFIFLFQKWSVCQQNPCLVGPATSPTHTRTLSTGTPCTSVVSLEFLHTQGHCQQERFALQWFYCNSYTHKDIVNRNALHFNDFTVIPINTKTLSTGTPYTSIISL